MLLRPSNNEGINLLLHCARGQASTGAEKAWRADMQPQQQEWLSTLLAYWPL
jgi:hypothetical protein